MSLRRKLGDLVLRLRHPKTTVRWRLTLLYGGLFLICGAVLLAVTYTLVAHAPVTRGPPFITSLAGRGFGSQVAPQTGTVRVRRPPPGVNALIQTPAGKEVIRLAGSQQRVADLHQLEVESAIALAIVAIISGALGWLVAGRVLRPLRTITATTQQISAANLHERLAMRGPRDELRGLADTIDGLLGRLQAAFDAQRRFVANASHELRTPLTAARALLEMSLTDPDATVETFRETSKQVLAESEQQEQLIDALLALAQGERGIDNHEPVDLAAITADALRLHELDATARGLQLDVSLEPALVSGDRRLLERLVSNLVENAVRYNAPRGHLRVRVETRAGEAALTIANCGPPVPADEIGRLLQPFQRLAPDRVGERDGFGLGLSIVAAIAAAHEATLVIHPRGRGGLEVDVRFPMAAGGPESAPPADEPHESHRTQALSAKIVS